MHLNRHPKSNFSYPNIDSHSETEFTRPKVNDGGWFGEQFKVFAIVFALCAHPVQTNIQRAAVSPLNSQQRVAANIVRAFFFFPRYFAPFFEKDVEL